MRATEKEVLKQVVQYENYKISDCGKVLSVGRYFKNQFGQSTKKSKDKFLKQYKTTTGYLQVDLSQILKTRKR